ncbi:MAG: methyltransferase domain-containing protein [Pirellulaceae bacterium]
MSTDTAIDRDRSTFSAPGNRTWAIFQLSVMSLFLEIMLIRWIGTEIRIFAYLQNTVLIVCFLGLGVGCFTARRPINLRHSLLALLALMSVLALPFTRRQVAQITELLSGFGELAIWGHEHGAGLGAALGGAALGLTMTLALLILLWEIFLPLGRLLGRMMDEHPHTITAYSANVAGSLIGIWLFALLSAASLPPAVWLILVGVLLAGFLGAGRTLLLNAALLAGVVLLGACAQRAPGALEVVWSPYQKLVLMDYQTIDGGDKTPWLGKYLITVNNASYQGMIDLSRERQQLDEQIPDDLRGVTQYDLPLRLKPRPKNVLIVGAGSGNDVAGALRGGAESITAVEIDPAIIEMGRRRHPERPYQAPNVTVVNDDARSFFAAADERYDLIIFGLLDSHTTTSMTNARLDHYVYTRESLGRARSLLADDGVMVLSFQAAKPFIADRMACCLGEVFGYEPLAFTIPFSGVGWGGVMFVAGNQQVIERSLAEDPQLAGRIAAWQSEHPLDLEHATRAATDDWPYIYLEQPRIPVLYFLLAGLMALLVGYSRLRVQTSLIAGWRSGHWHFFFLGAAFLLLEVQNISKASVVLGNTWIVNGVIISGILAMILLANLLTARFPRIPLPPVYGGLIASCLLLYLIDISQFAFLPFAVKAVIVGALTTLPMLFSGVIFIRSLAQVQRKDAALGANLIGALVGGMLQSVTFLVGIKALLLIVAALYVAAMLTRPRRPSAPQSDETPSGAARDAETEVELEPVGA